MICKSCHLVQFEEQHIKKTYGWVKNPELRQLFLMRGDVTWQGHLRYFSCAMSDQCQKIYSILDDTGEHIGNCGFKNILQNEGELWIYLGEPSVIGKGYGSKSCKLLIMKGFDTLDFQMIYLHVADFNTSAIAMYKKLGFYETPLKGDKEDWTDRGSEIIRMELKRRY